MPKSIIDNVWRLSPFFLFFLSLVPRNDIGEEQLSLFNKIWCSLVLPPIVFYVYHSPYVNKIKTGRSFKTRNGNEIDEYKDEHVEGKPVSKNVFGLMVIYFILGVFTIFIGYLFNIIK